MHCLVFYSWQSDLKNATNRSLIQRALEDAAARVRADESIKVEPVIDRDTQGVAGSPNIATTIFEKIDEAQIFVCDATIINPGAARPAPNPNVLVELGYALKRHGWDRILMVMNTAFGEPEQLPFDLLKHRVILCHSPEDAPERVTERRKLEGVFEEAIRGILVKIETALPAAAVSLVEQVEATIAGHQPNQASLARAFMADVINQIDALTPEFKEGDSQPWDERLVTSINESLQFVGEFTRVATCVGAFDAAQAAHALHSAFGEVLVRYEPRSSGSYYQVAFDFQKFAGHELFTTLIAALMREGRWDRLAELLDEEIYVPGAPDARRTAQPYHALNRHVELLDMAKQRRRLPVASYHADLLRERHSSGELQRSMPMQDFMDADLLLCLRAELSADQSTRWVQWIPWSTLYMRQAPRFIVQCVRVKQAASLLPAFGLSSVDELRDGLLRALPRVYELFANQVFYRPLGEFDPRTIGTRP